MTCNLLLMDLSGLWRAPTVGVSDAHPDAVVPRDPLWFQRLDSSPVADSSTAQTVTPLDLVSYHPDLKKQRYNRRDITAPPSIHI